MLRKCGILYCLYNLFLLLDIHVKTTPVHLSENITLYKNIGNSVLISVINNLLFDHCVMFSAVAACLCKDSNLLWEIDFSVLLSEPILSCAAGESILFKIQNTFVLNNSYTIHRGLVLSMQKQNNNSTNSYPCTATCMLLSVYLIILILVMSVLWRRTMLWTLILNTHMENELFSNSGKRSNYHRLVRRCILFLTVLRVDSSIL